MGRKSKSHEDFVKDVMNILGPEYQVLGKYIKCSEKIKMKHLKCGLEYETEPRTVMHGSGCPICNTDFHMSHDEFVSKVNKEGDNEYEVLTPYINTKTKVTLKHKVCNEIYEVAPRNFFQGKRCPKCTKVKRVTNEEFDRRLLNIYGNEWTRVSEFMAINKEILVKHENCGNIIKNTPKVILSQRFGCKYCKMTSGEFRIKSVLENLDIKFTPQKKFDDCKDLGYLFFDFYFCIDNKEYIIEYDGRQHFLPIFGHNDKERQERLEFTQKHDEMKNLYCENHNINLLRISYDTPYQNIQSIIENFIKKN